MSLARKFFWLTGGCLLGGPFEGMRYIPDAFHSTLLPKILGVYELELQGVLQAIIAAKPKAILDVGAAEGYYAVGLATKLPCAKVIAYEASAQGQELLAQLAHLNGVRDRLNICGLCTHEILAKSLAETPTDCLIMDVEGAETDLLSGSVLGLLRRTSLIVELHDFGTNAIRTPLCDRFNPTHEIALIQARPRLPSDVRQPFWRLLVTCLRLAGRDYLYERPPGMSWLHLKPRQSGKSPSKP